MKRTVELSVRLKPAICLLESSTGNGDALILRRSDIRVLALI